MSVFAVGDLHLSFGPEIEKPMDIFGGRWVNHAERLRENWETAVSEEDTVIIAGDFSWGLRLSEAEADFKWVHELPGKKVIIKGNHDLWWNSINKMNKMYDDMYFLQNHCYLTEDGSVAICGTRGWICPGTDGFDEHDRKIFEREKLRLKFSLEEAKSSGAGTIIGVLHYPPTNDKFQASEFTGLMTEYGVKTCVYGHLHGAESFKNGINGILNGVEYKLVSLDYLDAIPEKII